MEEVCHGPWEQALKVYSLALLSALSLFPVCE